MLSGHRPRALLDRVSGLTAAGAAAFVSCWCSPWPRPCWSNPGPSSATSPFAALLFGDSLRPDRNEFGFASFIIGTLWVTGLAMALSIPVSLLTAIYLAEYAGPRVRAAAKPLLDLLAGIPPVVYGLCGVLAVVPMVAWLGDRFGIMTTGYSVLAGGIILALMVFPITISVCVEVLRSVPRAAREAALALGATRWQMVKSVLLRAVYPGLSGRNRPRILPRLRRNHGRAHGGRERPSSPALALRSRLSPPRADRQQVRRNDVHPPL